MMMILLNNRKSALFVVFLIFFIFIVSCSVKDSAQTDKPLSEIKVDSLTIELTGQDSVSVLELLQQSHIIKMKSSAIGDFVTSIDSVENGSGYFWVYSVNDTVPKIACDKLFTRDNDIIKWHFKK